jgi:GTP pyrophosphokinase
MDNQTEHGSGSRAIFAQILSKLDGYATPEEQDLVLISFQKAASGGNQESIIGRERLLQVVLAAYELVLLKVGANIVAGYLLHHAIAIGAVRQKEISDFGEDVKTVVDRLSLLKAKFDLSMEAEQKDKNEFWQRKTMENSSNAMIALAQLPEVAATILADRLILLLHIDKLKENERVKLQLARQTLDVHSVVAEKLGIWSLKWKLDDAAFKVLEPDMYREIERDLDELRERRETSVRQAIEILSQVLANDGLDAEVTGRPKHLYGIYQKMKTLNLSAHEVNDILGLRVIVGTINECYLTLASLHRKWAPVEGIYGNKTYRDWIASPKPNNYQSLHTTVYYSEDNNRLLEVQIRTREMHGRAEYGSASHWIHRQAGQSKKLQRKYHELYAEDIARLRREFEQRQ